MKETKIVRENIKFYLENDEADVCKINLKSHKQTCQRWLEFLEDFNYKFFEINENEDINKKIQDLKRTIELYERAGI